MKSDSTRPGTVVVQHTDPSGRVGWLRFASPVGIAQARSRAEVVSALRRVEDAVERGYHAAGFVAYEAAPAFDPALVTRRPGRLPLLWFGLYDQPEEIAVERVAGLPRSSTPWRSSISRPSYLGAIRAIKRLIARGDTYQVNFSFRLFRPFSGSAWAFFLDLYRGQGVGHAAFVETADFAICSLSPELFFRLDGARVTCRPMKGTAPRGLAAEDDRRSAEALGQSPKNRAENIMIVDMVRNDLGRVARTGSVRVPQLFEVEQYDTLFQMTSTVCARTEASLGDIFRALFPPASITGAPKTRTMQIIAGLETTPRGVYTGCIGFVSPGRRAEFNVAIRTVSIDKRAGRAEYGVGGGIVWDSKGPDEYDECRTKGLALTRPAPPPFHLLETLRWKPGRGYWLLGDHLRRLADSARYFGVQASVKAAQTRLAQAARRFEERPRRVRLLVGKQGQIRVESTRLDESPPDRVWRVALARKPVDPRDRFLYHKTTNRAVYENARAQFPHHDDVILWNDRGEITESCIANVVVRFGRRLVTPPVSCGLLPGVFRAHLLRRGEISERVIRTKDLARADAVFLVNAVRGWIPVRLDARRIPDHPCRQRIRP